MGFDVVPVYDPGTSQTVDSSPRGEKTLASLRAYTYGLADERPSAVFPTSLVDQFINAGIKIVARTVSPRVSTMDAVVMPGVAAYALEDPEVFGRDCAIIGASFGGRRLERVAAQVAAASPRSGDPRFWYPDGASIVLYPTPTSAGTLSVTYYREVDDLVADTDVPPLSSVAAEAACIYAAYMMKMKDDEYSSADRLKEMFDRRVRELMGPRLGVHKGA